MNFSFSPFSVLFISLIDFFFPWFPLRSLLYLFKTSLHRDWIFLHRISVKPVKEKKSDYSQWCNDVNNRAEWLQQLIPRSSFEIACGDQRIKTMETRKISYFTLMFNILLNERLQWVMFFLSSHFCQTEQTTTRLEVKTKRMHFLSAFAFDADQKRTRGNQSTLIAKKEKLYSKRKNFYSSFSIEKSLISRAK